MNKIIIPKRNFSEPRHNYVGREDGRESEKQTRKCDEIGRG